MGERVAYDEFGLFHENAAEFGLPYDGPPVVRRASVEVSGDRQLSALVWGDAPPELVLLHGGAQNAHTWDTVAMALGRPLVAIDLPGHGHSDAPAEGSLDVRTNAADVAAAVRELAPDARGVVGMSLGGLTTIALADGHPELVRKVVLVDVTPKVEGPGAAAIIAFVNGPGELRRLRRAPRPHDRVQPHPLRVVAAPGHPPQRPPARGRQLGVALPALHRRAPPSARCRPTTCGTPSSGSPSR